MTTDIRLEDDYVGIDGDVKISGITTATVVNASQVLLHEVDVVNIPGIVGSPSHKPSVLRRTFDVAEELKTLRAEIFALKQQVAQLLARP